MENGMVTFTFRMRGWNGLVCFLINVEKMKVILMFSCEIKKRKWKGKTTTTTTKHDKKKCILICSNSEHFGRALKWIDEQNTKQRNTSNPNGLFFDNPNCCLFPSKYQLHVFNLFPCGFTTNKNYSMIA